MLGSVVDEFLTELRLGKLLDFIPRNISQNLKVSSPRYCEASIVNIRSSGVEYLNA